MAKQLKFHQDARDALKRGVDAVADAVARLLAARAAPRAPGARLEAVLADADRRFVAALEAELACGRADG